MNFSYTGRSSEGAVNGVLEGASASAVADALLARGITPLTITQAAGSALHAATAGAALRIDFKKWLQPKVQLVDLLLFSRQLHTLLKAGVPILRALAGLQESAPNPRMQQTLQQVRQSLGSGIELSMSFAQHAEVLGYGSGGDVQALRKSMMVPFATMERPSRPASAAGLTYAAVASFCPATADPASDRSRALVLGTA